MTPPTLTATRIWSALAWAALAGAVLVGCEDRPAEPDAAPPVPDVAAPDVSPPDVAPPDAAVDAGPDATLDAQIVMGQVTVIKLDLPDKPGGKRKVQKRTPKPPASPRQASIMGTIRKHQNEVVDCYAKVAQKKPSVAGQLTVKWTLGADGMPTVASIAQDTLGDPAVGNCVKAKAVGWKFPPPQGGVGVVKYTWTLKLQ